MPLERFDQTDKTAQLAGAAFDAVNVFVVLQSTVKTGLVRECIVGYPVDRRKTMPRFGTLMIRFTEISSKPFSTVRKYANRSLISRRW